MFYSCLMVIAGTVSAPSLGSKNVMILGMLLPCIMLLSPGHRWHLIFQHRAWVQKMIAGMLLHFFMPILKGHPRHFSAPSLIGFRKCHDNVTAIYYACLMVIAVAGTFQHRAWDHLIAGMLIQFITLVLLWTLPALFSTELGYKKCHDSWNVTSICYACLMVIAGTFQHRAWVQKMS